MRNRTGLALVGAVVLLGAAPGVHAEPDAGAPEVGAPEVGAPAVSAPAVSAPKVVAPPAVPQAADPEPAAKPRRPGPEDPDWIEGARPSVFSPGPAVGRHLRAPEWKPIPSSDPDGPPPRRPGTGLSLFAGYTIGGNNIYKERVPSGDDATLSAGAGYILGLGAMITPLWFENEWGLGLSVDGSFKYSHVDGYLTDASLVRYPLAVTVHLLAGGLGSVHYVLFKLGAIKDFDVTPGGGLATTLYRNIESTWGPTASFGYYRKLNDVLAWDVLGYFAFTDHVNQASDGGEWHASSLGVTTAIHANL
jgi:hypothetical protein